MPATAESAYGAAIPESRGDWGGGNGSLAQGLDAIVTELLRAGRDDVVARPTPPARRGEAVVAKAPLRLVPGRLTRVRLCPPPPRAQLVQVFSWTLRGRAADTAPVTLSDLPVRKVAEATGIDPATLRVWERRYGRPVPRRTPSGQRRYSADDVAYLRRVATALKAGHRAARVLGCDADELERLLAADEDNAAAAAERRLRERMLAATAALDEAAFFAVFDEASAERPLARLLDDVVGPFLSDLGAAWAAGRLEVRHEHFTSALVSGRLAERRAADLAARQDAPPREGAPRVALTTPAGEEHGLGLAMVAAVLAERGVPHVLLGPDLPVDQIVRAARELSADAVALGTTLYSAGPALERTVRELRAELPPHVELMLGGSGAAGRKRRPRGVRTFESLAAFAGALDRFQKDANK